MLRFLRTQPGSRFVQARRSEELDGRGTKSLGGKSKRVVLPFFIADDSHFLDVLTLLHHEAHVAPVSAPLPAFEGFKNDEGADLPFPLDGYFGNLEDPIMISLLEHSPNFYLQQFPHSIDYFYRHGRALLLIPN